MESTSDRQSAAPASARQIPHAGDGTSRRVGPRADATRVKQDAGVSVGSGCSGGAGGADRVRNVRRHHQPGRVRLGQEAEALYPASSLDRH